MIEQIRRLTHLRGRPNPRSEACPARETTSLFIAVNRWQTGHLPNLFGALRGKNTALQRSASPPSPASWRKSFFISQDEGDGCDAPKPRAWLRVLQPSRWDLPLIQDPAVGTVSLAQSSEELRRLEPRRQHACVLAVWCFTTIRNANRAACIACGADSPRPAAEPSLCPVALPPFASGACSHAPSACGGGSLLPSFDGWLLHAQSGLNRHRN
jgi:hypothetical protein